MVQLALIFFNTSPRGYSALPGDLSNTYTVIPAGLLDLARKLPLRDRQHQQENREGGAVLIPENPDDDDRIRAVRHNVRAGRDYSRELNLDPDLDLRLRLPCR